MFGWLVPFYDEAKVGVLIFFGLFGGAHKVYPLLEPLLLKGEEVCMRTRLLCNGVE